MSKPNLKFKKGQLAVVARRYAHCGCNGINAGVIIRLESDVTSLKYVDFRRYPIGIVDEIPVENIRPLAPGKERLKAKAAFEKATPYDYATVIGL